MINMLDITTRTKETDMLIIGLVLMLCVASEYDVQDMKSKEVQVVEVKKTWRDYR